MIATNGNFLATAIVVIAWFSFAIVMLRRPKPPESVVSPSAPATLTRTRDRRSMIGIALQGVAYAVVWSLPRFGFARMIVETQHGTWGPLSAIWLAIIAALMVSGVALARSAIYTLGKQWTVVATVGQGHSLVTSGPYARVRHPIYTAMLFLLIGTGLAMSGALQLSVALVVFSLGTAVRVRIEERLLEATHGAEFQAYRRRVPAVIPRRPKAGR